MTPKIETYFEAPVLTTQFPICPIPFRVDTYKGCVHNCHYCFSRYFTTYSRRDRTLDKWWQNPDPKSKFTHLVGNDPVKFKQWLKKAHESEYNFKRGAEVAIKERIPLKIGGVADPCPPLEIRFRITHKILEALHEYDYPVTILTKNPSILANYLDDFHNPNWSIACTIISLDRNFIETCEPGAPSVQNRLKAVERMASRGQKVMCKIQPAIYPKIMHDLPDLVKAFKEHGAWAFNTEGLKVRIVMNPEEVRLFEKIGKYSGDDEFEGLGIRKYYRLRGIKIGSDMEMTFEKKKQYTDLSLELSNQYNIKYFTADNHMGRVGYSCECCGTQVLRNYKIWGHNIRTRFWGKLEHESEVMKKVIFNSFSYSGDPRRYRTIGSIMDDELSQEGKL